SCFQRIVICLYILFIIFFFQAEDGIRDRNVTGVQTCALPISYLIYKSMNAMFMNTYFQTMNRQHSVKSKKIFKVIVIRKSKNTVNGHSLLITLKSKVNKLEINPKNIIIPLVTLF